MYCASTGKRRQQMPERGLGPVLQRGPAHRLAVPLPVVAGAAVREQAAAHVPGLRARRARLLRAQREDHQDSPYTQPFAGSFIG